MSSVTAAAGGGWRDRAPGGRSLVTRLLLAQGAVLMASVVTAAMVAVAVGPPLFHDHMMQAGHMPGPEAMGHIEEAYWSAGVITLGVALAFALGCALAVTWYLGRRLQRPLEALTGAARAISAGDFESRVSATGAGPELDSLAEAFNVMAGRLQTTEEVRRRLLSDLAHEMRTPVATISAHLDGLEDQVATWGPEEARVLRTHTDRLARLARDLDEVSRAEEGRLELHPRAFEVAAALRTAAEAQREPYAGKGVALTVQPVPGALWVQGDPTRVQQIIGNLLGNALRHTPAGGSVTLAAAADDGTVRVAVSDTGDGIPAEQLPHLFERFFRGDTARERDSRGSGIGLTISRALAEQQGGSLTATSPGPGRGARFTLSLPAAETAFIEPSPDHDETQGVQPARWA
jgi:signal transduction histidine kinase